MRDEHQHIVDRLGQLLEHTRELSRCEQDPTVDVAGLTNACRSTLAELKRIMPAGAPWWNGKEGSLEDEADARGRIEEMLKALDVETRHCMEVLIRCRNQTEDELSSLRQTRKAIRAYRNR